MMRYFIELVEGRDAYLYHGTALVNALSILKDDKIYGSNDYYNSKVHGINSERGAVATSRSYSTAKAFGTYWDREFPVVLMLDQRKLSQRHAIKPYRDYSAFGDVRPAEFEESVPGDIPNLSRYLVSINVDLADLKKAISDKEYVSYMMEQYEEWFGSKKDFVAAMRSLLKHPILNKVSPRG